MDLSKIKLSFLEIVSDAYSKRIADNALRFISETDDYHNHNCASPTSSIKLDPVQSDEAVSKMEMLRVSVQGVVNSIDKFSKRTVNSSTEEVTVLKKHLAQVRKCIKSNRSLIKDRLKKRKSEYDEKDVFHITNVLHSRNLSNWTEHRFDHLGLKFTSDGIPTKFHDTELVCVSSSRSIARDLAESCLEMLATNIPSGLALLDLCPVVSSCSMFKAGPVLVLAHSGGGEALSSALNEVFQLLHRAGVTRKVKFIQIGSSSGIAVRPGSVLVTRTIFNGLFQTVHRQMVLGKEQIFSNRLDEAFCEDLLNCGKDDGLGIPVIDGNTLSVDGFYEAEGRLNGAFSAYSHVERIKFFQECLTQYGICNFDPEAHIFGVLTRRAGVQAAILSVVIVDRFTEDDTNPKEIHMKEWYSRPQRLLEKYIHGNLTVWSADHGKKPEVNLLETVTAEMITMAVLEKELDMFSDKLAAKQPLNSCERK